jgi:nucleotide-binding universal stress UspA family protein
MSTLPEESIQQKNVVFRHILFATDFSVASGRALPFALALSCRYGASATVAHIIPPITREVISLDSLSRELHCRRREAEQAMKVILENTDFTDFHQVAHHELLEEGPYGVPFLR